MKRRMTNSSDDTGDAKRTRRQFLQGSAKAALTVAAAGPIAAALTRCGGGPGTGLDVIIRGGRIYNGISDTPRAADIGIRGDRIEMIGDLAGAAAGRVIDAAGLIVTPGFIDVHTHCDLTFLRTGIKRHLARLMPSWKGNYNYLYQGVTTVVTGNCGYGYTDTEQWLGIAESVGFGSNVAHLIPHGALREEVGAATGPLTREHLRALKRRIAEEMGKGAAGLSCGLAYAPGIYASTEEMAALAGEAGRRGGVFAIHMRDDTIFPSVPGTEGAIATVGEAIEIGRRSGAPVQISHLKIPIPIGRRGPGELLRTIEAARRRGLDITADQYPYDSGATGIMVLLPNEFVTSEGVKEEFRTADGRRRISQAIEASFRVLPPERTIISYYPDHQEFEGKNLREIAEMRGVSPAEAYTDMVCGEATAPQGTFLSQEMSVVRALMPYDYVFTASDGWTVPKDMMKPHPRTYGTFPRKLKRFAIQERIMSLPAAIRSMTSLPAAKFRIRGRGVIAPGNYADIAVIDTERLADHATYEHPHRYATGIVHLLVNGVRAIENGVATGDRGGRALRIS
ncbi:MAG: amidohydrolase family protein [Spirochaetes bacterium]|nr:amidohydrolase family protein [Spirochaetota bacterium]